MAVKDWSPDAMAKFIVITALINFFSLGLLLFVAFDNIGNIGDNTDRALSNTHRVDVAVYTACVEANAEAKRTNTYSDSALDAELRNKVPDTQRVADLGAFKRTVRDCGPNPER